MSETRRSSPSNEAGKALQSLAPIPDMYVYVYMYVCMYVYIYIYVCIVLFLFKIYDIALFSLLAYEPKPS